MKTKPLIIVQLVHIEGPFKGQIQELSDPEILIGRHPSCQVRFPVDHAIISRKHAKIVRDGNRFKFVDQSTNGTFLNGKKIKEAILKDGDVLIFAKGGPKISFLTRTSDRVADAEPEPVLSTEGKTALDDMATDASSRREKQTEPAPKQASQRQAPPRQPPEFQNHSSPPFKDIRPEKVKIPLSVVFGPTLRSYKELPIIIGRSPDCDFPMEHPQIFDHHAQVFFHENQYWIKDLTGKKLVLIDGSPVELQAPLVTNCEVGLTRKGPDFKFLGQGRLVEIEKTFSSAIEEVKEEFNVNEEEPDDVKKKPSLIDKLWRR